MADLDAPLMEKVLNVAKRKRIPDIQHHRQADDVGTRLEVAEWGAFGHSETLARRPVRLKRVSSDRAVCSTIKSCNRRRKIARSLPVWAARLDCAQAATMIASWVSGTPMSGNTAMVSPVAGLATSNDLPVVDWPSQVPATSPAQRRRDGSLTCFVRLLAIMDRSSVRRGSLHYTDQPSGQLCGHSVSMQLAALRARSSRWGGTAMWIPMGKPS
jgi:hypothetical protein